MGCQVRAQAMLFRASILQVALIAVLGAVGCHRPGPAPAAAPPTTVASPEVEPVVDPHSYGRPHEVAVRHLGLNLTADFKRRILEGTATYTLERADLDAPLRLDTRALTIDRIEVAQASPSLDRSRLADASAQWEEATWTAGEPDPILGTGIEVQLPFGADLVRIHYQTTPGATGLQWLTPEQTAEGKAPFLYTQSQAIHARSWIPCQDSPGSRMTYDAIVRAPSPLSVLMSAQSDPVRESGSFSFSMPQAIPPYLVALAIGVLEFRPLGPRSGVWAEPSVLPTAAAEFGDVENMITGIEELYGPYRWGRYDILVLPPAFPFGGMENPRLTFATPTILAGDRSLVALIAHELAHSWSGNLATNATWADLWLNEGFTVYIERRIMEALFGRERAEMEAMLGRQDLEAELADLEDADERLVVDLSTRDPDDGLSNVPYEKGALLLRALEEAYGREAFDPVLNAWFSENAFQSVTTDKFVAFVETRLFAKHTPLAGKRKPSLEGWLHEPGVGPDAPTPTSEAFSKVDGAVKAYVDGAEAGSLSTSGWTPHEWLHFLRGLPTDLPSERLAQLDATFELTRTQNSEILAQWLELGVRHTYPGVDQALETFLLGVGRRKFLTPLYRALVESERVDDAKRIYTAARAGYHPITQRTLDALIEGASG